MSPKTLIDRIKNFVGKISFDIFLWSINMTENQYLEEIRKD